MDHCSGGDAAAELRQIMSFLLVQQINWFGGGAAGMSSSVVLRVCFVGVGDAAAWLQTNLSTAFLLSFNGCFS